MLLYEIIFNAVWYKSITNQAPDTLSHNPIDVPGQQELLVESDKGDYQELLIAKIRNIHQDGLDSIWLQELHKFAQEDTEYQRLTYVRSML